MNNNYHQELLEIFADDGGYFNEKLIIKKDLLERFRKIENEKSNPSIKKFFQKAKSFWNS